MVKRVYIIFDNEEFQYLKKIKEQLGLSWPEAVKQGLECLSKEKRKEN